MITFENEEIPATQEEVQTLIGKTGIVRFPQLILDGKVVRQEQFINASGIRRIVPRQTYEADKMMDRKKAMHGMLHDGTKVMRYFGTWYLDGDIDERGRPSKMIDPAYYPEVAMDCVPTVEEYYQKYAHLPREERKKLITGSRESRAGAELKRIEFKDVEKHV